MVLAVGPELADALSFPPWTGTVMTYGGLLTFLIGMMAWVTGLSRHRRAWGRSVAVSGVGLAVVGFAFETFLEVLQYVLTG